MAKKRKFSAGGGDQTTVAEFKLTALQIETIETIARERDLELPHNYAKDFSYGTAFLDKLSMHPRNNPKREVVRFLNNVTRDVEHGARVVNIAAKYGVPTSFALTM
jgi:hypothetical protein